MEVEEKLSPSRVAHAINESMSLTAECSRIGSAAVVRVVGAVDGETASELQRVCRQAMAVGDKTLILDFTGVEYVSSAGLGTVLVAGKQISGIGGQLRICGLSPRVKKIFDLAGFDTLFGFYDSPEDAMVDCRNGNS